MEDHKISAANGTSEEAPEFEKLLRALKDEVEISSELNNRAFYFANNLQMMKDGPVEIQPENKDTVIDAEPLGVIALLWREVWTLRTYNSKMSRVVAHLQKTIGG